MKELASKQDLIDKIIKYSSYDEMIKDLIMPTTHIRRHINMDHTVALNEAVEILLSESNKKYVSTFINKDAVYDEVCKTIEANIADIKTWLANTENGHNTSFSMKVPTKKGERPLGFGFIADKETSTFATYSTDTIRVVIQKNNDLPLGFGVITAFPDLYDEKKRKIPLDLARHAPNTTVYKTADAIGKAYIDYLVNADKNIQTSYEKGSISDDSSILIVVPDNNAKHIKHVIRVKEDSTTMITTNMSAKNRSYYPLITTKYTAEYNKRIIGPTYQLITDFSQKETAALFKADYPEAYKIAETLSVKIKEHRKTTGIRYQEPKRYPKMPSEIKDNYDIYQFQ